MSRNIIPSAPKFAVAVISETPVALPGTEGFLRVRRYNVALTGPDGGVSPHFTHDVVERRATDAAIIVAYYVLNGVPYVYLRSAVRPACALRREPPEDDGLLWEVPAGLIEPGEGAATAAARELGEELGFFLDESRIEELGPWTFPAPGVIGERHVFFAAEVHPNERTAPSLDGSVLEQGASIISVPLDEALQAAALGELRDAKTELGLLRLHRLLALRRGGSEAARTAEAL